MPATDYDNTAATIAAVRTAPLLATRIVARTATAAATTGIGFSIAAWGNSCIRTGTIAALTAATQAALRTCARDANTTATSTAVIFLHAGDRTSKANAAYAIWRIGRCIGSCAARTATARAKASCGDDGNSIFVVELGFGCVPAVKTLKPRPSDSFCTT